MEKKTYYMILGATRTEAPSGIRAAYRDRARRLHPDVAGEGATRAFQMVAEAYDVLFDPGRRREYNARLGAASPIRELISTSAPAQACPSGKSRMRRPARTQRSS